VAWVLIPCLKALFAEFDRIAPNRARASDGAIGDSEHSKHVSDHNPDETGAVPVHDADNVNEVHAIDVTTELNESDLTMEKCVQKILTHCRRKSSDPLNEDRLRYIIYNRRIWRAPLWREEVYTGTSDPHTGHAHFSAEYITSLESKTTTWHLEEIPVALTAADKTWIANEIKAATTATVADMLAAKINDKANPDRTVGDVLRDAAKKRGYEVGDAKDTANAAIADDAPIARWTAAADKILAK
jgi:hypothetical protein